MQVRGVVRVARLILVAAVAWLAGCTANRGSFATSLLAPPRSLVLHDAARGRDVPVLLYSPVRARMHLPLAVISHGYRIGPDEYSALAGELVRRGFLVASIRHVELAGDPPMENAGDLARLRLPVWKIGADSITFVIAELRRHGLANDARVVAIGHSNGGDMTMLLATIRPELLKRAISLDNRRMPLPRTRSPAVCTIRSADQTPDPGVLPTPAERRMFGILVLRTDVRHVDMGDAADASGRAELVRALRRCLAMPAP